MANPVRLSTAHPPQHTVGLEPVTAQLRQATGADGSVAVVERWEGRPVKVCTTDARPQYGIRLDATGRGYASTYGTVFIGARLADAGEGFPLAHPSHPQVRAALGEDAAESAECRFDPELHTGPTPAGLTPVVLAGGTGETAEQQAARVEVARQVCQECPIRPRCLAFALAVRPDAGVWAGHTAAELGVIADALHELAEVA